ncbi:hypothetical protein CTAYLR_005204 [Chrysophaeum taylorii]|uniref:Peptidase A1 domain-containing protein n=1 Tax=Chrysophaeum taylorii TaxID=2483200 RepID=A0AAD7XKD6_9STRA|nr:hypothetical protein CTAYLR_005204 [Chrysophaeum taylorii]
MLVFIPLAAAGAQVVSLRSRPRGLRSEVEGRVSRYNEHASQRTGRLFEVKRRPEATTTTGEVISAADHEILSYWDYPMTLDYVVELAVANGTKFGEYPVIVDTGSSNLALALESCSCGVGSTDLDIPTLDKCIDVVYGSGAWSGRETVATKVGFLEGVGKPLLADTSFSGITSQKDFFSGGGYHGILGLGYPGLAEGYSNCDDDAKSRRRRLEEDDSSAAATPLVDVMYEAGLIASNVFSLTFCSSTAMLSIGGLDTNVSDITFVDAEKTYGEFYGYYLVSLASVSVDGVDLGVPAVALNMIGGVLVDSGTTLIYLPEIATMRIEGLVAASNPSLSWPFFNMQTCVSSLDSFPDVTLYLNGYALTLAPTEYTLLYGGCYYWGISASDVGIIGNIALQDKIVVFDRDDNKIGFGSANCEEGGGGGGGAATTKDLRLADYHSSEEEEEALLQQQHRAAVAPPFAAAVALAVGAFVVGAAVSKVQTRLRSKFRYEPIRNLEVA